MRLITIGCSALAIACAILVDASSSTAHSPRTSSNGESRSTLAPSAPPATPFAPQMNMNAHALHEILRAAEFAALKHKSQRRKNPGDIPYINHPLGVAYILTTYGVSDIATLQAALLHDTIEDTATSFSELEAEFGKEVTEIVRDCTDDKTLSYDMRKQLQIDTAPHKPNKAKLVKMADKLYNLREAAVSSPVGWPPKRVYEYFKWAQKVTNGCRGVNAGLDAALDAVYADYFANHHSAE